MESTGEFWKPIYNLLEACFTVLVVNAHHIKNVPGRKTDVKDAEWIADLLRHGLVRGNFIPPLPQRDLRDLTRQRTLLVQERASVVNRLQKVLEWANIKLAGVATDILGKSARAMLEAIVDGQSDVTVLADLARGRLRSKRAALEQALEGRVREHHRFMLAQHLTHIDFLDEQIAAFNTRVEQALAANTEMPPAAPPKRSAGTGQAVNDAEQPLVVPNWQEAVVIWDSIPGIGQRVAEQLVAEVGTDLSRFPSSAHLASWAKLSPSNHDHAGKRLSGAIGKGNQWLRTALIQAGHAAVKGKDSYFRAFYRRLVARRGVKKAIVAVAHNLLTIAYRLLEKREMYCDPGPAALDARRAEQVAQRLQRRIEQLGYKVQLEPLQGAA